MSRVAPFEPMGSPAGSKSRKQPITRGLNSITDAQDYTRKLTPKEIQEIKDVFSLFDTSGDGTIDRKELLTALRSLGQELTEKEAGELLAKVDTDRSGTISLTEFLQLTAAAKANEDVEEQLRAVFQRFDKDGDGLINESDLMRTMKELGQPLSHQDCDLILNDAKFDVSPYPLSVSTCCLRQLRYPPHRRRRRENVL